MTDPFKPKLGQLLTLAQLQRVKLWHAAHEREGTLEYRIWQLVLTVWLMGWMGWLPAFVFDANWAYPLCVAGMLLPQAYICARARAQSAGLLRCDWLHLLQ
jgi:hypothetical protein